MVYQTAQQILEMAVKSMFINPQFSNGFLGILLVSRLYLPSELMRVYDYKTASPGTWILMDYGYRFSVRV